MVGLADVYCAAVGGVRRVMEHDGVEQGLIATFETGMLRVVREPEKAVGARPIAPARRRCTGSAGACTGCASSAPRRARRRRRATRQAGAAAPRASSAPIRAAWCRERARGARRGGASADSHVAERYAELSRVCGMPPVPTSLSKSRKSAARALAFRRPLMVSQYLVSRGIPMHVSRIPLSLVRCAP